MGGTYWLTTVLLLALTLTTWTSPAFAQDLKSAKAQGLIGEMTTGYLGAVKAVTPEVQQLIASVNSERKQRYQDIAAKNGTPVGAVEALAARKAIEMTPAGEYVQNPDGSWQKK